jgi:hypothetical protein
MRWRFWTAFAVGIVSFASAASAQVSWNGYDWYVDRFDPEKFEPYGPFQGKPDALHIYLGPSGYTGNSFLNYQGRKATVNVQGASFATGDLYVPGNWAGQQPVHFQSTGLWGGIATASNSTPFAYPIIAFSNSDSGPAGRFQVWDADAGGWVFSNAPVAYDGWNTLRMEFTPGASNKVDFFINGTLVYTDTVIGTDPTSYLKEIILNSYNNNASPYDVFWANVLVGLLQQDPSAYEVTGAVPDMTKYYIYSSIGDLASRRGAEATEHFSPYDYVWAYAGGTTGQFDLSNSSGYDATTYFLRSGIDIIQPMESLRLGLTVSAGRAEVDADSGGSADSDNYSAGGYLTYATRELYVDVLTEYAWSEWNVAVPNNGSDKSNVDTYVASGEVGTSLWMAKGVRVVPNASLLYLNTDYKDMSFNIASVSFAGDEALIGRVGARLEYMISSSFGGSRVYAGVSAVKDLMDEEGVASVQSVALPGGQAVSFAGGFGSETAAQFNGGIDLKIAKGTRLYGDTSYITGGDVDAFRGSGGFIVNW